MKVTITHTNIYQPIIRVRTQRYLNLYKALDISLEIIKITKIWLNPSLLLSDMVGKKGTLKERW